LFHIGPYHIGSQTLLAPMAGVSDLPFRRLCSRLGAGLATSEMVTADTRLWQTDKSRNRLMWEGISGPRSVQIAGSDPVQMAEAARACANLGAQILDINMGCPAKKVCNKAAGSALLKDEPLVVDILQAVVAATTIPVTLKFRTGWDAENRNAVRIARLAQDCGVQALTLHGRTRACRFEGAAEYDTIGEVVAAVDIPVIANGDIDSPHKARQVLLHTNAAAVMIGRAAQGNPWLFGQVNRFLASGVIASGPDLSAVAALMQEHFTALYEFYGTYLGCRIARKHLGWYLDGHLAWRFPAHLKADVWRQSFNALSTPEEQLNAVAQLSDRLNPLEDQAA
jgi:tRNA-dihydrouridine synthase B